MKIYHYDGDTFEYLCASDAELDPAELAINHKKVYLIPANATKMKPPKTGNYEVALWDETNWKTEPDYRNTYIINEFLEIKFIQEIGAIPEGYFPITAEEAEQVKADPLYYIVDNGKLVKNPNYDAQKLEQAKEAKLQEILTKAKTFIEVDAVYRYDESNTIEATDGNIGKLTAYALGFQAEMFEKVEWTSKEDNVITLNAEDCLRVLTGLGAIQSSIWNEQYIAYKTAINEAETIEEIEEIEVQYEC